MKKQLEEFREKAIKLAAAIHNVSVGRTFTKVMIGIDGNIIVIFSDFNGEIDVSLSPDDVNNEDFDGTVLLLKKHKEDKENAIRLREADILAEANRKKLVEEKSMYLKLKAKFEGENKY